MEATIKRRIKSGAEFEHLFPVPFVEDIEIKKDADVSATIAFIPEVVLDTLDDTAKIAEKLKGRTLNETCENIWHFVYEHIQYAKDKEGVEQIRRPARAWHDRTRGVDCDCYTVFISSILTNLNIPHTHRITKYQYRTNFQHIYPIVPTGNGKYITIDCVVNEYNYEEPFTEKKDTPMKLHYLNGIDAEQNQTARVTDNVDTLDLMGTEDVEDIGKVNFKKVKEKAKKTVHLVNKVNPATALLRAGVLASMKLNVMKIAGNIRYAYLNEQQAQAKNLDMDKYRKLKSILSKLENIFYGAGGKPENLKAAILSGKGNSDREISGLEGAEDNSFYDENTPLNVLLSGMHDESEAIEGLNGLGVVTSAAIAAASSALAVVAGLIKQIGPLKKGGKNNQKENNAASGESESSTEMRTTTSPETPSTENKGSGNKVEAGDKPTGFLEITKAWVKEHPIKTGAVVLGATVLTVMAVKHFSKKKKQQPSALAGAHQTKNKKKKAKAKAAAHAHHAKTAIALL